MKRDAFTPTTERLQAVATRRPHAAVNKTLGGPALAGAGFEACFGGRYAGRRMARCVEFPHLLRLVQQGQFDTLYHEHFSYLSLTAVQRIFAAQGLEVWEVEQLPTHGGSLRVWARHAGHPRPVHGRVDGRLAIEHQAGMQAHSFYQGLQPRCEAIKDELLSFLVLPWNLSDEITAQLALAREWGARFVTAVPRLRVG